MLLNRDRLHALMAAEGLDAVVATAPENVTYMSGYWALSQWIRRGPQTYVVWPAPGRGAPCVIASSGLLDLFADQDVWIDRVRRFGSFVVERTGDARLSAPEQRQADLFDLPDDGGAGDALVRVLTDLNLARGRIAIDEMGLSAAVERQIRAAFDSASFVPGFAFLRRVRAVKTEEEIARLRGAARIAEASIDAALAVAAPGVSEAALGRAFHTRTVQDGAVPVLGCIGTGPRSAMANVQPSDRTLQPGDVIRFDVGGRYKHYRADIARNAVLGSADARTRTYHRALRVGVDRAYDIIRPGVTAAVVFQEVVETVRREGLPHYRRSHVGHGIGIDGYDLPNLTPASRDVLEEGMVLCVETPYYELGFAGLQVEDMAVIRKDGLESLMNSSRELRFI